MRRSSRSGMVMAAVVAALWSFSAAHAFTSPSGVAAFASWAAVLGTGGTGGPGTGHAVNACPKTSCCGYIICGGSACNCDTTDCVCTT